MLREGCEGEPESRAGRYNYHSALAWPCGAKLFTGHESSGGLVELPGGACDMLGGRVVHCLLRSLLFGGRCTRLDVCRDRTAPDGGLTLLADALASCKRGELCHARGWKQYAEGCSAGGEAVLTGLYLGSSKSPRFVRLYDKGVEQGASGPGRWVRWEAQLRDDFANEAALALSGVEEWGEVALAFAVGVVDFLQSPDERHLGRRERAPWFEAFCRSSGRLRTRMESSGSTVEGFLSYAERCVLRTIVAACREAGRDPGRIMTEALRLVEPTGATFKNPVVYELARLIRAGRWPLDPGGMTRVP